MCCWNLLFLFHVSYVIGKNRIKYVRFSWKLSKSLDNSAIVTLFTVAGERLLISMSNRLTRPTSLYVHMQQWSLFLFLQHCECVQTDVDSIKPANSEFISINSTRLRAETHNNCVCRMNSDVDSCGKIYSKETCKNIVHFQKNSVELDLNLHYK